MIDVAKKAAPGLALLLLLVGPFTGKSAWAVEEGGDWRRSPVAPERSQPGHVAFHSQGNESDDRAQLAFAQRVPDANPDQNQASREELQGEHPAAAPATLTERAVVSDAVAWRAEGQTVTWEQTGIASWYGGSRWQGHPTFSGERYNENALTAAHATLPMGAKIRVSLKNSDKFVIVIINDRPGTRKRIIDLSRQAAAALGILNQGIAVVTLQRL